MSEEDDRLEMAEAMRHKAGSKTIAEEAVACLLDAQLNAQISIAISLQRIAEALERAHPEVNIFSEAEGRQSERAAILAYLQQFDVGEDWNLARGLVADIEGNKHLLSFAGASPVGECWCGASAAAPLHDPVYGSHVFGSEPPADKGYGGTE